MASMSETVNHPQNRSVFMKLLFYSFLMISLPIGTYFFLLNVVWKGDPNKTGWSGIGAVCVCNLVIAAYAIMAWGEVDDGPSDIEYIYVDDGSDEDTEIPLLSDNNDMRQRNITQQHTLSGSEVPTLPKTREKDHMKGKKGE